MYQFLFYTICFLCTRIFALKPSWSNTKLVQSSGTESTQWPLKAGYPGLAIDNLNEYVKLFSHCLVNIQNYQGIEIIGIQSPVYITRFDVAYAAFCHPLYGYKENRFQIR